MKFNTISEANQLIYKVEIYQKLDTQMSVNLFAQISALFLARLTQIQTRIKS